jgi:hypothetical protein
VPAAGERGDVRLLAKGKKCGLQRNRISLREEVSYISVVWGLWNEFENRPSSSVIYGNC